MNSQKRIKFEIIKPPHVRIADLFFNFGIKVCDLLKSLLSFSFPITCFALMNEMRRSAKELRRISLVFPDNKDAYPLASTRFLTYFYNFSSVATRGNNIEPINFPF